MVDNRNPLLDDDDDEELGIFPKAKGPSELPEFSDLPESIALPDSMPTSLPSGKEEEPEMPDLESLLGEIDYDGVETGSGIPELTVPETVFDPADLLTDNEYSYEATDSLEDLLGTLEPDEPLAPVASIDDYSSPRSLEDEMDFEGSNLDLDAVIGMAIEAGASDIHLAPFDEVAFTVLGEIRRISEFGEIDSNMTVRLQQTIISNVLEQSFVEELELDTSYVVKSGKYKGRRLRLSVGKTESNIFMVFRVIAATMPTPDELDIPQNMRNWVNLPNGLVLVNGPTGSGKSTTLSSLVQEIQMTRAEKVITIEKPIEYVYGVKPGQKAYITQREVGKDSRTFAAALTSAMRQAPNIILVGEVRNREEIDELLRAAETGHLAISTLHTTSCPATINRIRSMYEGDEQLRVLATLADNLRGMMTQTLVKSPDGKKRTAVREVLEINSELKQMVLKGDVLGIRQYMEDTGTTMEHELVKAVKAGFASLDSARSKAPNPLYFDELYES